MKWVSAYIGDGSQPTYEEWKLNKIVRRIEGSRELAGFFDRVRHQIRAFARTEVARTHVQGRLWAYDKAGVDVVKFAGKPTSCPLCGPLVGNIYYRGELGAGETPPIHPNCIHDLIAVTRQKNLLSADDIKLPRWDTECVFHHFYKVTLPQKFALESLPSLLRAVPGDYRGVIFPDEVLQRIKEIRVTTMGITHLGDYTAVFDEISRTITKYGEIRLNRITPKEWAKTLAHECTHHLQNNYDFYTGKLKVVPTPEGLKLLQINQPWVIETYKSVVRRVLTELFNQAPENRKAFIRRLLRSIDRPGFGEHYEAG